MKSRVIIVICISFLSIHAWIVTEQMPFSPVNTVIAFDFHGVIARTSLGGLLYGFSQIPTLELIKLIPSLPFIISDLITFKLNNEISEDILHKLAERYPIVSRLENDIIRLSNQQKPRNGIHELLLQLKSQGYRLVLASNIGEKTLKDLYVRASDPMHAILSMFDYFVTPTKETNYTYKPHAEYYKFLLALLPQDKIIFFDDKEVNRHAAIEHGIFAFDTHAMRVTLQGLHCIPLLPTTPKKD